MQIDERLAFLGNIDLFSSFSKEDLSEFAAKIDEISLAEGELLFREGDAGYDMYILVSGRLKVFRESRTITLIEPMDYVGEMAIIEQKNRSASVQALMPSLLLRVTLELFHEFFSRQPPSLVAMMTTLSRRIRRDTEDIAAECEKANMMIHDMKNLLSPFYLLEVLEKKVPQVAGHRYVEYMTLARDNLLLMMDEALASAKRLEWPSRKVPHSLPDLVRGVVASEFAAHPDLAGKELRVRVEEELPEFAFSSLDVRRVLNNLIVNAAQASGPGAAIEVEVGRRNGQAMVKVRDQGRGIPENLKEKIFQSHFTTKAKGSGLGLASCKFIIEKGHGGILFFESKPGGGTTFVFTLPLA
ncbi:MAG: ATP-binding protein [Thermodesulfobacteriota bacterium]